MRDTYDIGPTPNGEDCAQVGTDGYYERSIKECNAYLKQLERTFPGMPSGMYLRVTSHNHDFGTYHEVSVVYDDSNEEHADFLYGDDKLECGCEFWDEEAKQELGIE